MQLKFMLRCLVCLGFLGRAFAADPAPQDNPALEPFMLTPELASELTQPDVSKNAAGSFRLKGIAITASRDDDTITLSADTDRRLNLWRGGAQDFAGSHMGGLKITIASIVDAEGKNIHATAREEARYSNVPVNYLGGDLFRGSRRTYLQEGADKSSARKITGVIQLTLPVNITKYVVKADAPDSAKPLLARGDVKNVKLRTSSIANSITFYHPQALPNFRVTLMGFGSKGERLKVTSDGTPIETVHWYSFGQSKESIPYSEVFVFLPEKFVDYEIPFSIELAGQ